MSHQNINGAQIPSYILSLKFPPFPLSHPFFSSLPSTLCFLSYSPGYFFPTDQLSSLPLSFQPFPLYSSNFNSFPVLCKAFLSKVFFLAFISLLVYIFFLGSNLMQDAILRVTSVHLNPPQIHFVPKFDHLGDYFKIIL